MFPEGAAIVELAAVVSLKLLPSSLPGIARAVDESSPVTSPSVLIFFRVVVLHMALQLQLQDHAAEGTTMHVSRYNGRHVHAMAVTTGTSTVGTSTAQRIHAL